MVTWKEMLHDTAQLAKQVAIVYVQCHTGQNPTEIVKELFDFRTNMAKIAYRYSTSNMIKKILTFNI